MSAANDSRAIAFDHIALAVPDGAKVGPFLAGALGGHPHHAGPGVGYRFWQWEFAGGGRIEVLRPDGPPGGFVHRFLDARGPGVHHVTFKVPELRAAADRARALGYEPVGYDDSQPHWKEAFLHPREAQGIVVQLAEDHSERYGGPAAHLPFPDEPAGPAATVVGLRLAARSAAAARRQWQELLGGACEPSGDALHFRWPGSFLRIAVAIEPDAPEGPLCVEVAAERPLALPPGPHPVLGARFIQVKR